MKIPHRLGDAFFCLVLRIVGQTSVGRRLPTHQQTGQRLPPLLTVPGLPKPPCSMHRRHAHLCSHGKKTPDALRFWQMTQICLPLVSRKGAVMEYSLAMPI